MTEWTVTIDSPEGTTHDVDALERLHDALDAAGMFLGAAASLNMKTGVLSATFQLEADSEGDAVGAAVVGFTFALHKSGIPVIADAPFRVELTPETGEPGAEEVLETLLASLSVSVRRERAIA